nr:pseudouridine synthase [Geomonas sp. Red32]
MPAADLPYPSLPEFFSSRFPAISRAVWERRILDGKVLDEAGHPVTLDSSYCPGKRLLYRREVDREPVVPFRERILYQDDHLLVCCKPHFLPVNPSGPYVEECLMNRLRKATGNPDLVPINRIDRETAGLVLFSATRATRDAYCRLFRDKKVEKLYEAVARCQELPTVDEWLVESRIVKGDPWFRMRSVDEEPNARSAIKLEAVKDGRGKFQLRPVTGKTHQLRIHMSGLGFGIENDRLYPELQPQRADDFAKPLQLIARELRFVDPLNGEERVFRSERQLQW